MISAATGASPPSTGGVDGTLLGKGVGLYNWPEASKPGDGGISCEINWLWPRQIISINLGLI